MSRPRSQGKAEKAKPAAKAAKPAKPAAKTAAKAKSGARPAARAGAARGVYVSSPKSDIFVLMLSIALGAMVLGSLLMVLILARYDFKVKAVAAPSTVSALALA